MPNSSIGSSFTHACLKVPLNPYSGYPSPLFERSYDIFTTMSSNRESSVCESRPVSGRSSNSRRKIGIRSHTSARNDESKPPLKSLIEFYESIPDYGDMNHLSEEEFNRKLQSLKEKQKLYTESLNKVSSDETLNEDIKSEATSKEIYSSEHGVTSDITKGIVGVNCFDNKMKQKREPVDRTKKSKSPFRSPGDYDIVSETWSQPSKIIGKKKQKFLEASTSEESTVESLDNTHSEKKEDLNDGLAFYGTKRSPKKGLEKTSIQLHKNPKKTEKQLINLMRGARSRMKRPLSQVHASSVSLADSNWDNFSLDDCYSKSAISLSDSDSNTDLRCHICPRQSKSVAWRVPKITVPKPFPLTLREKENQQIHPSENQSLDSNLNFTPEGKKSFRANPVPVTSRIPLFDKIMNDQEKRSREVKKKSKAKLDSMMKPFSFVRREEDDRILSHSTPELHHIGKPVKMFKAKPVPKNLFSSEVYERMREDEYYRTLKKRIRSEELLRSSSLPPSMAAREKYCLNKEKYELEDSGKEKHKSCCKKKKRKIPDYKLSHDILRMELDGRKNEKITTTPHPFHFETADRKSRRSESAKRCCNSSSLRKNSPNGSRIRPVSAGTYVLHRDNLASVLRIQSSRERTEKEKLKRIEEKRLREEMRIREKEFRKNPAWKIVSGWTGVEEDLAIRASSRQEEEDRQRRLHQRQMETMMSRVYRIPTLFERQSEMKLPKKFINEVHLKRSLKIPVKEEKSRRRSPKQSVRLLARKDFSNSPSPHDPTKTEYDESYDTDPEDDKTCRQSIDEDIEEETGVEDEIKDEEVGDEQQKDKSDDEKGDEASHNSGDCGVEKDLKENDEK